jgi:hypothetical protein
MPITQARRHALRKRQHGGESKIFVGDDFGFGITMGRRTYAIAAVNYGTRGNHRERGLR